MHDGLTWRAGPPRGCDVALRPRDRATGVGCDQDGYDRVDPSPRDHQIHHVRKRET